MENKIIKLPSEIKVKPKLADVVNAMQPGDSVLFKAIEFGPLQSARGAVCRMNQRSGGQNYSVISSDNGVTYTISRK